VDDDLRQRLGDWSDPVKRAAYLRDDAEQVRLLHASAAIRKRHAANMAVYAAQQPTVTRRRRGQVISIWERY
jgi:hypothetical protein